MDNLLTCHYHNTSPLRTSHEGSASETLLAEFRRIALLRSGAYASHNEVIRLPLDPNILGDVKKVAERFYTSQLKFIIVIGIGGSNLGTRAIYDALRGPFDLLSDKVPKLLFLDTTSARMIHDLEEVLGDVHHKEEIIINLVSKSGTTTESVANFELLMLHLMQHVEGIEERVVCTTDAHSALWKIAEQKKYGLLEIPKVVGGRFSVFSSVGLFPLLLAGVDVVALREGAKDMLAQCLSDDPNTHHARRSAEIMYAEMQRGVAILNIFHFAPELESLGKWERQLVAESLGKEKDLSGKVVRAGITPIVSIGSTDLHSMAQLYFGGPKDKFTMLVHTGSTSSRRVPEQGILGGLVSGIAGKSPGTIMSAIFDGVVCGYQKNTLPFAEVRFPSVSPYVLGAYLEWRMLAVIHLAALMHVDPFDQPNVEDYKEGTRRILGSLKD